MRLKICMVGLLFALLAVPIQAALAQQSADPLSGTWKGDWGPSPTDRNAVTLDLKWDGKVLTGTVNPGPDAIQIENASFDPKTAKIHLEANLARRNLRYVVEGTVEKGKMTGAWNHPRRKGDFQLAREARRAESIAAPDNPGLAGLRGNDRRVVEYLLNEWGKDFSITSVDIAMDALRIRPSDDLRFRIGNHIKNHPELHAVLRQWGWETIVLMPDEKLVARAIVNRERDKQKPPSKAEVAKMVGISEKEVERAVEMLSRYEILKRDRSGGGIGYVATKPRYVNWQPWLDFQFHRVTLASGRTFCVNWAADFLSLVSGKLSSERITIDDSSPDGTARIQVVFDKGQVVKAEPESTVVFMGGGWAVNNLFSSEEALNRWLERHPELKGRPYGSVAQTLEQIKARQRTQWKNLHWCIAAVFASVAESLAGLGPALGLMLASPALNPAALALTLLEYGEETLMSGAHSKSSDWQSMNRSELPAV